MFVITALAALPVLAHGGAFFATHKPSQDVPSIGRERLQALLPQEYGGDHVTGSSSNLAALAPLFGAMPKDQNGGLGPSTVRYALKRYFTTQTLSGFDPTSPTFDGAATAQAEQIPMEQAAAFMQHSMLQSLGGSGSFGLRELSALAASLERLVEADMADRFGQAVQVHGLEGAYLEESSAETVLYTYMLAHVLGFNPAAATEQELEERRQAVWEVFPNWGQVWQAARAVLTETLNGRQALSRHEAEHVAAAASQRVAALFQETGCSALKKTLVAFEDGGSGRVALNNFYKAASDGWTWHFQENRDYLRALSVLDETDQKTTRVVVPNYVASQPNCIAAAGLSAVCCISECEKLLKRVEEEVSGPEGEASRIIALIEATNSSTVAAPRQLSPMLKQRLQKVADRHGGRVPLHGRLFSQWLHHAFPRECPYPRAPGATTGAEVAATRAASDMSAAEHFAPRSMVGAPVGIGMEELDPAFKMARDAAKPQKSLRVEICRMIFLLIALGATGVGLWRTAWSALVSSGLVEPQPQPKVD
eukprot:TRINITY_DN81133_c0_g1_i1.p1 TRINITY_DN81133_c0_g1~~TRINITY_DN81133_c0_g1_i1.p1  ORF type:complete len:535 (-),score=151.65 TRINITY_DN81133_c0_g1_i1:93-1697(-)